MCNSWKIAIGEFIKKKPSCSCWQVCKRSGAKAKAIKNFVRGHAVHDGRLLQQQRSCPVSVFIRWPLRLYSSTSWILLQGRGGWGRGSSGWSQTSLLRFSHTRLKQTGKRGVALLKAFAGRAGGTPGADQQASECRRDYSK